MAFRQRELQKKNYAKALQ